LPADPRTVIAFLGNQSTKKITDSDHNEYELAASSIALKLAAIKYFHNKSGLASPTDHPQVQEIMRGLYRNNSRETRVTYHAPILYEELELLLTEIRQEPDFKAKRNKAIILLGLQGGFRRSELANIKITDLHFRNDELLVTVPFSKTNQMAKKEIKYLPCNEIFSAYDAVKAWLDVSGLKHGYLFRSIAKSGNGFKDKAKSNKLDGKDIYRMIKRYCKLAGLNESLFGAHSLRSGCVTQLHKNGKDSLYIMSRTGHKDPKTLQRYFKPKE
jgi:integrase